MPEKKRNERQKKKRSLVKISWSELRATLVEEEEEEKEEKEGKKKKKLLKVVT